MSVLRRIFTAILALALLLTLAGCQCKHKWAEADCLNPRTCTRCGETEGEPLGHDWAEATCQAPKTCTRCALTEGETIDHSWKAATCEAPETCAVCGLTRGETLGHTWKEVNYQDPETCTTCGATRGDPLEADFEKYGLEINLWENKHYIEKTENSSTFYFVDMEDGFPYVTACPQDKTKKTTGALYLCNYRIFQSDETHQAVDGYEWRAFDVEIEFSDENAQEYGVSCCLDSTDYYEIGSTKGEHHQDINDYDKKTSSAIGTQWEYLLEIADAVSMGEVSFHGETYSTVQSIENFGFGNSRTEYKKDGTQERVIPFSVNMYFCVPTGYDGIVFVMVDLGIDIADKYIYEWADENTLFFRLDDQVLDIVIK